MRHLLPITQTRQWLGMLVSMTLLAMAGMTAGADDPLSDDSPPVFQPNEIQHGFAEYDTPPDFFSDDGPTPYDDYSHAPTVPPSEQKPGGLFHSLDFAESVEEDRTIRRGHIYVPVNPTSTFSPDAPSVYLVFAVHKHLTSYQIIGRLFQEAETGLDSTQWLDEDMADLATEDESGFLKFFPQGESWQPGRYRVDLYVGYIANPVNKMGTLRFTVRPSPGVPAAP